ncbi:protein-tyrosine phosphatase containing protein [Aphelenchoides avenae]|nr:protein-tyrosine phosphatase containing protein [Aphelenchus avenae]
MPPTTFMEKLKKKIKNREQEKEEIEKLEATSDTNSKRKKSPKPKSKNKSKQTAKKDGKDRKKGAGKDTDKQVSEEESHDESGKGNKKKKQGAKVQVMTKAPNADKEVADWTEKIVQKGLLLLCADFDKLKTWQPPNRDATAFNAPQNADKNRSKDLPCLDVSRVRLKDDAYIHANYVATAKSEKQFICTQAPLDNTVETFWRMTLKRVDTNLKSQVAE